MKQEERKDQELVRQQIKLLAETICDTEIYRSYRVQVEKLKNYPELFEEINRFRMENFELQNSPETEDFFEKVEAFGKKYEHFRENPMVSDFLQAELDVCRLMQEVHVSLTDAIDFV